MAGSNDKKSIRMYIEDDKISMLFFWFLTILFSILSMTKNCFSSALAAIVSEGVMKKSQTGLITSAFYISYGPLQIVGGIMADRFKPDKMVKVGLLGSAIANAIIFLNHNYYVMLCAWFFNGITQMAVYPALFKIITSQLSPSWRKKGIYYFSFAGTIGLMLSYMVAAIVTGWKYNFLISSVASFVLLVAMVVFYSLVSKRMIPDETPIVNVQKISKTEKISAIKLFALSGFLFMIPVNLIKYMVDNSIKTFTPIMMVESYSDLSVSLGNLLSILILISGLLGMILVRKFLFPKIMRNEMGVNLLMLALVFPFVLIIKFTGRLDVWLIVGAMCMASVFMSGASLMNGFINGSFSKYGKNGTAAGITNSASSLGVVLQSYGFTFLADHFGWGAVTDIYVIGVVVCIVFTACALPLWVRFKKQ